jgi:DNA ligase-1
MKFFILVNYFQKLEKLSSRNSMIKILKELFEKSSTSDIDKICYLILGKIAGEYENIQLGISDEMVKSSIALAANVDDNEINKEMRNTGDLGKVASKMIKGKKKKFEKFFDCKKVLDVNKIYEGLMKIVEAKGSGSQKSKQKTLTAMLTCTSPEERRYLIGIVTGEMRLGIGEMTVLDGLAANFLESKKDRKELEFAYNVCSDIGHVAKILAKNGIEGVKHIRPAINRPIKPMLAQRVSEMSDIRKKIDSDLIAAEEKYDGERIQAHKDDNKIRLFSRRLTDVTDQFPDVVENVRKHVKVKKAIIDGEVVAYNFKDNRYYPFQKLMQRRRKYDVDQYAKKIPIRYMVFDLLYLDGKSQMDNGYPKRRKKLEQLIKKRKYIGLADQIKSSELDEIDDFFQDCIKRGLEGIVCKSCLKSAIYRAGARGYSWIKWKQSYATKLSDTLDLVVVGAYAGKGKRGGTYGALLCAAYNKDKDIFQTVCKLGAGFSDKVLKNLKKRLSDAKESRVPKRVMKKQNKPDYWFRPKYVIEVKGSEFTESPFHTCNWNEKENRGLSLRFPRFKRWRPEKSPEQATTVKEIVNMYKSQ